MEIKRFFDEYRWLSNFWPCQVIWCEKTFSSVEHAFQAAKCVNIEDFNKFLEINNKHAREAKALGQIIKCRKDWQDIKYSIMNHLVRQKFDAIRNPELYSKLLELPADVYLEEGNTWHDCYWGACSCKKCTSLTKHNNLGKILMEVRKAM